jgi:sulfonate transport system permease protein
MKLASIAKGALIPLGLIGLWSYASTLGPSYAYAFVPLATIAAGFRELLASGDLFVHLAASLETTLIGLALGSLAGFLLGSAMALSRPVEIVFAPLFNALRQIPTFGLIPLVALWFGTNEIAIRLLVSLAVFEVIGLNSYEGLRGVEARYIELGRALMFTPAQRFFRILLPAAFPVILTGLLQAVSFAWIATVGAELLIASGPGVGVIMQHAQLAARMDIVIVCLLFIAAMGFVMNSLMARLGRRALHWRETR